MADYIKAIQGLNGLFSIQKPIGISSFFAAFLVKKAIARALAMNYVADEKQIMKGLKIGHGGTLDPFATGVLGTFLT